MKAKTILHLCADIGSDSRYYDLDPNYEVIKIGKDIGVENFSAKGMHIYGVIANPVCTEFSNIQGRRENEKDYEKGLLLVNHCIRIITECNPVFYLIENPAKGDLHRFLGKPQLKYQPWEYGSPWTKETAIWGSFNIPKPIYSKWEDVPKLPLYVRPNRKKPSLAVFHKSAKELIPEMEYAKDLINCDMSIRSWCSQGFAKAFYECNP
ncbi:MAG: hypothetical protein V4497_09430 [Bacteroidota bacterium]